MYINIGPHWKIIKGTNHRIYTVYKYGGGVSRRDAEGFPRVTQWYSIGAECDNYLL